MNSHPYLRTSDLIEMGNRFTGRIAALLIEHPFPDNPLAGHLDPRATIRSLAGALAAAVARLATAMTASRTARGTVTVARSGRIAAVETGLTTLKAVRADAEAALLRLSRDGAVDTPAHLAALFPFGAPGTVRPRLDDLLLALGQVMEGAAVTPGILGRECLAELAATRTMLAGQHARWQTSVAATVAAHRQLRAARDHFLAVWRLSKGFVGGLAAVYPIPEPIQRQLFADRDAHWVATRTGRPAGPPGAQPDDGTATDGPALPHPGNGSSDQPQTEAAPPA